MANVMVSPTYLLSQIKGNDLVINESLDLLDSVKNHPLNAFSAGVVASNSTIYQVTSIQVLLPISFLPDPSFQPFNVYFLSLAAQAAAFVPLQNSSLNVIDTTNGCQGINGTGSIIPAGSIVCETARNADGTPIIALTNPAALATAIPVGVAINDIAPGQSGPLLREGLLYGPNTLGAVLGQQVFAAAAGAFSLAPGAFPVVPEAFGCIASIGNPGSINVSAC